MIRRSKIFWQASLAGLLTTIVSFYYLGATSAGPQASFNPAIKPAGDLWVSGSVLLNGVTAKPGTTVLSGARVKTLSNGVATINVNRLGRVRLEPDTEMTLRFSTGLIAGDLTVGQAGVITAEGTGVSIATPRGQVDTEDKKASSLQLFVTAEATSVGALRGNARINSNGQVERITTGEEVTFNKPGQGISRRVLGGAMAGAVGVAGSLGALTTESLNSAVARISGSVSSAGVTEYTGAARPLAQATPGQMTPVTPPPSVNVCGCAFNAQTGNPVDPSGVALICHVPANDPSRRITILVTCASLRTHINLTGFPRAGHLCDRCGSCSGYFPPNTCPVR